MGSLNLPDFAIAADADVETFLPSLDGRWSAQTRAILARLGSDRLNLSTRWADTPTNWRCPSCRRHKPDIARLTPSGVVLCQLELHHDHLGERGVRILWEGQRKPENRAGADALHSAINACSALSERFHPTLVCCDCNAADGAAKAALGPALEEDFSFAPSEIARFIRIAPNRPHEIDVEAARVIWWEVAEDVRDRLAFMAVMARRVAQGRHVREGSGYRPDAKAVVMTDLFGAIEGRGAADRLMGEIQARSLQRDAFASSAKASPNRKFPIPTHEDLTRFTGGVRRGDFWLEPPDDWCCAVCERTRFQMLRKSPKSGLWTAGAHRRRVFSVERRPDALWARNGWYDQSVTYGDHEVVWVCKDCRQIVTDTKHTGQNLSDDCLGVDDLRALLIAARPHERPEYDREIAARMARNNYEHMAAVQDYDVHRRRCLDLVYSRRQMLRFEPDCVVDQHLLEAVWENHMGPEQRPAHLAWLIEEGSRYAEANARLMRTLNPQEAGG